MIKHEIRNNIKKHLDVLCNKIGERHLGSKGEKKAVKYINDHFESLGYEVINEGYNVPGWRYGAYSLKVVETGTVLPGFPCQHSCSCDVKGKLVVIDIGNIDKLVSLAPRGKIFFCTESTSLGNVEERNKLAEELDRLGAAALIIVSDYQDTVNTKIIRTPRLKRLGVMTVSRATALEIGRNFQNSFKIKIEAKNFTTRSCNIIGKDKIRQNKRMAVVAHYDTAPGTVGATDNASGVAVLLELARLFKTIERDYSVDFIAFGAEEFRGTGAKEYAKKHKKEFKNISLCWNMDCLGTVLGRNILQVRKARKMADILKREFPDVHVEHFDAPGGHDARVFSENKVPVVYFHTQWDQFPQIHSPNDNLTRINFNKLADMCEISFHILKDFFVRFYTN